MKYEKAVSDTESIKVKIKGVNFINQKKILNASKSFNSNVSYDQKRATITIPFKEKFNIKDKDHFDSINKKVQHNYLAVLKNRTDSVAEALESCNKDLKKVDLFSIVNNELASVIKKAIGNEYKQQQNLIEWYKLLN